MTTTERDNHQIVRPHWLTTDAWPYEIKTANISGSPIAYTDEGKGPSILLLTDGLWSFVWAPLIAELVKDHRVITLDFPGSGLSPTNGSPVELASDSAFLEEFVASLGLKSFTLVVHDLGGAVGLGLAVRNPDMIDALALVNTFAWEPDTRGLRLMLKLMASGAVTSLNTATNLVFRLTSSSFGVGRHLDSAGRKAFLGPYRDRQLRLRFHRLMASALANSGYLGGVSTSLERLSDKPVLTVYGEKNDPFGFQARFKEVFPEASEVVIPDGNHFPMCDEPTTVANHIREVVRAAA